MGWMPVDHASGTKPIPRPPRRDQLGLLRRLLRTPESVLDELDGSSGPIGGMGAGPLRVVVVGSPSAPHPPKPVGLIVSQPTGGALMHVRPRLTTVER